MTWTIDAKIEAAVEAPRTTALHRPDTRVIERPGWYQLVTPSAPEAILNEVVLSSVDEEDAERVIDEVIAAYRANGNSVKWCVGPWTRPLDFGERLARRGFSSWDVHAMVSETSGGGRSARGIDAFEVGATELEDYVTATLAGWDRPRQTWPTELEVYRAAFAATPRVVHFFAARVGGQIVATAAVILRGRYAYMIGGQVHAAYRGRGLYAALVAARLAFLDARGVTLAVTQARAATSAPILARLGWEVVYRSKCYLLA